MKKYLIMLLFLNSLNAFTQELLIFQLPISKGTELYEGPVLEIKDLELQSLKVENTLKNFLKIEDDKLFIETENNGLQLKYRYGIAKEEKGGIEIDLCSILPVFLVMPKDINIDQILLKKYSSRSFGIKTVPEMKVFAPYEARSINVEGMTLDTLDVIVNELDIFISGFEIADKNIVRYEKGDFVGYTTGKAIVLSFSFFDSEKIIFPILVNQR